MPNDLFSRDVKEDGDDDKLEMNKLSLSIFFFGENIDPIVMIEPWNMKVSFGDMPGLRSIEVDMEDLTTTLSYQDYQLMMKTQEKWLITISGSNDKKEIEIKN